MNRKRYLISIISLITAIFLVASGIVYSWYIKYRENEIGTGTAVITPYTFYVGAGNNDEIQNLDMGNLDIKNPSYKSSFVFCVVGKPASNYFVQLAYTTNIPFTYTLYRSTLCSFADQAGAYSSFDEVDYTLTQKTELDTDYDAYYKNLDGNGYYFKKSSQLSMDFLNKNSDNIASDKYHEESYGTYSQVQKNSRALYQKSDEVSINASEGEKNMFEHYYILEISWGADLTNNKEVDQVYLTVSLS